jgi:hypothetical protein
VVARVETVETVETVEEFDRGGVIALGGRTRTLAFVALCRGNITSGNDSRLSRPASATRYWYVYVEEDMLIVRPSSGAEWVVSGLLRPLRVCGGPRIFAPGHGRNDDG